jgi:hypothetical protein
MVPRHSPTKHGLCVNTHYRERSSDADFAAPGTGADRDRRGLRGRLRLQRGRASSTSPPLTGPFAAALTGGGSSA